MKKGSKKLPLISLDVGCGSRQILDNIKECFNIEDIYLGVERLPSAVNLAKQKVIKEKPIKFFLAKF